MIDSTLLDARNENKQWPKPESEVEEVKIYENENKQVICIRADLSPRDKNMLVNLIKQYKEIFAWSPIDMPRIDVEITCHKLSIDPNIKPIQRKKRNHGVEWQKAIKEEVTKLLDAGFIREVHHTTWLANAMPVKKSNGS